ncbi:MAG: SMP-30/gluconolactonase/LRE family protein [Verrucomicrobiae bacterium]|nr:SMP-30/gluconolactonase/LRE family protein [Verrucomicrobiae bacterium]
MHATELHRAAASLGEGALWDDRAARLLWVDILRGEVHSFDPATGRDSCLRLGEPVGTVVPHADGGWVVARKTDIIHLDPVTTRITRLADPQDIPSHSRWNDGKCDPSGRLWVGTLSALPGTPPVSALYRVDLDGKINALIPRVRISNGLAWSADATKMYYIDSLRRSVDVFDFQNGSGRIFNRRVLADTRPWPGVPDGMAIDAEGHLWVAFYGGHAVLRFDGITGKLSGRVEVPTACVTSCALGGPDFQTLFITTARGEEPDAAHGGHLFAGRVPVPGLPCHRAAIRLS